MKAQWSRLEEYLRRCKDETLSDLNQPATDDEINELELAVGATLPEDFVSFLKVHNGQKGRAEWLFDGDEFLPTKKILRTWSVLRSLHENGDFDSLTVCAEKEIRSCWWSPKWIPITSNGMGDHLCLDLDPSPYGTHGQVIKFIHDAPTRTRIAKSLAVWFAEFVGKKGGGNE